MTRLQVRFEVTSPFSPERRSVAIRSLFGRRITRNANRTLSDRLNAIEKAFKLSQIFGQPDALVANKSVSLFKINSSQRSLRFYARIRLPSSHYAPPE